VTTKPLSDKIAIFVAVWFFILFTIMHLTYPDNISPDEGMSFFGLATSPSGISNTVTMVLFNLMLIGLGLGFMVQAALLLKISKLYCVIHVIMGVGFILVMFPFDLYKQIHDIGANIVYFLALILAIRISVYGLKHDYKKWVEYSIIGFSGVLTIFLILFIGFWLAIVLIGGILQRIYLMLFFILYSGFRIKTVSE
jgi:hypothetical protein